MTVSLSYFLFRFTASFHYHLSSVNFILSSLPTIMSQTDSVHLCWTVNGIAWKLGGFTKKVSNNSDSSFSEMEAGIWILLKLPNFQAVSQYGNTSIVIILLRLYFITSCTCLEMTVLPLVFIIRIY